MLENETAFKAKERILEGLARHCNPFSFFPSQFRSRIYCCMLRFIPFSSLSIVHEGYENGCICFSQKSQVTTKAIFWTITRTIRVIDQHLLFTLGRHYYETALGVFAITTKTSKGRPDFAKCLLCMSQKAHLIISRQNIKVGAYRVLSYLSNQ